MVAAAVEGDEKMLLILSSRAGRKTDRKRLDGEKRKASRFGTKMKRMSGVGVEVELCPDEKEVRHS